MLCVYRCSGTVHAVGCDQESTTDNIYGVYLWPATTAEATSRLPCNYSGLKDDPMTYRLCGSQREWGTIDYDECFTYITMLYQTIDTVSFLFFTV